MHLFIILMIKLLFLGLEGDIFILLLNWQGDFLLTLTIWMASLLPSWKNTPTKLQLKVGIWTYFLVRAQNIAVFYKCHNMYICTLWVFQESDLALARITAGCQLHTAANFTFIFSWMVSFIVSLHQLTCFDTSVSEVPSLIMHQYMKVK